MTDLIRYTAGNNEIELTPGIVRQYLVSGKGKVSDQEVMMFLKLCQHQKLNPFLREVYLIKYSDSAPATMVTGKETFLKRAVRNPKYQGHETGISEDGQKAWAKVYVKDYKVPITCEVDWDEYVGTREEWVAGKKTGKKIVNSMWESKGKTMLKKVALVQALREAFPEDMGGLYSQEEINHIQNELPDEKITPPDRKGKLKLEPLKENLAEKAQKEAVDIEKKREEIRIKTLDMFKGDKAKASKYLEKLSSYTDTDGTKKTGASSTMFLTDKQIKDIYKENALDHAKWQESNIDID